MCSTCPSTYAANSAARYYQPELPVSDMRVRSPSFAYNHLIRGKPCTQKVNAFAPLNERMAQFANEPMRNIDGQVIHGASPCALACDNSGNSMIVPTPFKPRLNYYLPGGTISAVRVFKQCDQQ